MEYGGIALAGIGGGGGGSGGCGGGDGSDHHHDDPSDPRKKKKRYHRHTAQQIQKLEAVFKEFPHPDEKQRLQLSRDLGLSVRQIKFWFQNRRTQMKAQHERADNCALRAENDKIRCENIAIREALKNIICPSCGGPPVTEDSYFDEQKLRLENAQLKEELDRVSSIAAKYIGGPISHLPVVQPVHISSLDLSMGSFGGISRPSLDLDLLSTPSTLPFHHLAISDMDRSLMTDIAVNAMEELLRLLQTNEPLWVNSSTDGRDVLNFETYQKIFPSCTRISDARVEASRDSGIVNMNASTLVDMFIDLNKWVELFPTIVSMAKTLEIISTGMLGSQSGSLQLMHEELQVLSPLVPTREFYTLRYCQQLEQGLWAIVNVSHDISESVSQHQSRRLPSGCLIQDMPNGYSKVTWVEHMLIDHKTPTHHLYLDLIHSGMAFGAERWLATLERMCERAASLMGPASLIRDAGVGMPPDARRSMIKLAQRMVNNFCTSTSPTNSHQWTTISGLEESGVRVTLHKSPDPGQHNSGVLCAATTFWLPVSAQNAFNFFKDERNRPQWDVLASCNAVQEIAHIANGPHPGNCISVLRALNTSQNNMLILQESCIDSTGSLVVYCPIDLPAINIAMSGQDPSCIPLLPSGFAISPDGNNQHGGGEDGASTSSNTHGNSSRSRGSLITVAFQILVSSLPYAKLNLESVTTVNNMINTTVQQIKAAMNCPSS